MPRKAKTSGKQKLKTHKALLPEMLPVQGKSIIKRVKRLAPYLKKYKANPPA